MDSTPAGVPSAAGGPSREVVVDGMRLRRDVAVPMDDGIMLRADVFLPQALGVYPALVSYGPYAKDLPFQEGYPSAWAALAAEHPDVTAGSSNKYQNWEVVDPEKWIPHGYAVVRVDSRGCGRSPGFVDHFSARETRDFAAVIAWVAEEEFCDGAVGLSGVSYYGMNQWLVAAQRPPALRAICVWEGAADFYRDASHHGGILSTFWENWYDKQIKVVQHGLGVNGLRNPLTGEPVCGDVTLTPDDLIANRVDFGSDIRAHEFVDTYHRERTADLAAIEVPLYSAGNWGGQGLHLRGNIEGFLGAGSEHKWLEVHGLEHWTSYYTDYGRERQLRFFDHFLKGVDNGWDRRPRIELQTRCMDGTFRTRFADAWPPPETSWVGHYLDPSTQGLTEQMPSAGTANFDVAGDGLLFRTAPFTSEVEITGSVSARLWVSTTAADADLFLVLHALGPDGQEVTFVGAVDPNAPASMGWLRLSHRELDEERSTPYRPWHRHERPAGVERRQVYEVEVEIWPTSLVLPAGYSLGLSVQGHDYLNPKVPTIMMSNFKNAMTGSGPFLHDDPLDRPNERFAGRTTLHVGPRTPSSVLIPFLA